MSEINYVESLSREDYDYDVVAELYDSVTFQRGMGDSGREIRIVEKECQNPNCSYDRQIQVIHVKPEMADSFTYHCQNPCCPNYHNDKLGIPGRIR